MKPITVAKLISILKKENPKRIVVLASDSEGNRFDLMAHYGPCAFDPETRETGLETITPEDRDDGYSEEDIMENGKPALILYP